MKLNILSIFMLSAILTLSACKKSDAVLTPSGIDDTYTVPQGNSPYDQTIVDYYKKYGTYLLYKFSEKDAYWTPTGSKKPVKLSTGFYQEGGEVAPADPNYIPAQLNLIQSKWFSFYTDKFLKQFLPTKILLCSKVDSVYTAFVYTPVFSTSKGAKKVGAYYNYDNIAVNYGDEMVNTMTVEDQRLFIYKANLTFIQSIIGRGLLVPTSEFMTSADYSTAMTTTTQAYGKGIIIGPSSPTAQLDWNAYVRAMVTYSTVQLNASVSISDTTPAGILNATKDTSGQIKRRYNAVRNYYINEYGVDLQVIGNATRGL